MADEYGSDFITIVDEDGTELNWKFLLPLNTMPRPIWPSHWLELKRKIWKSVF